MQTDDHTACDFVVIDLSIDKRVVLCTFLHNENVMLEVNEFEVEMHIYMDDGYVRWVPKMAQCDLVSDKS